MSLPSLPESTLCFIPKDIWQKYTTIHQQDISASLLMMYLLSNSRLQQSGDYKLPLSVIAEELMEPVTEVKRALHVLCDHGFCQYDWQKQFVYAPLIKEIYEDLAKTQANGVRLGEKRP